MGRQFIFVKVTTVRHLENVRVNLNLLMREAVKGRAPCWLDSPARQPEGRTCSFPDSVVGVGGRPVGSGGAEDYPAASEQSAVQLMRLERAEVEAKDRLGTVIRQVAQAECRTIHGRCVLVVGCWLLVVGLRAA